MTIRIVTLEEFVAVEEPGAGSLVGEPGEALISQGGDVMFYGDGGAGKTTLVVDGAFHMAAGEPWLGIPIARPLRVLIVENEGPRPPFRAKLKRKIEAWAGSPVEGRLHVWEEPWAAVRFTDEQWRTILAEQIRDLEIDVVIIGPVTASGMLEAGTLQDVRAFHSLIDKVRILAGRLVTFCLVHHENKGGQVSGAWEGVGDTLLHVQAQGHGRTRLYVQKARWSSEWHLKTLNLIWAEGDSFTVEDKPELDDDTLAEQILATIGETPGISWSKVEAATKGVGKERRRAVRDGLFAAGRILNVVKTDGIEAALRACPERQKASLFLADDPALKHLRPGSGAVGAQSAPPWGADEALTLRRAPRPIRGAGVGAAQTPPAKPAQTASPLPGDEGFPDFLIATVRAGHITDGEALERHSLHKLLVNAGKA